MAFTAVFLSCSERPTPVTDLRCPESDALKEAPLAAGNVDGDCGPEPRPPLCEWANSVDAVVVGDVTEVKPLTSPLWVNDNGNFYLSNGTTCPGGFINYGIVFEVAVKDVLYGTADGDALFVVVPTEGWEWANRPTKATDGGVKWIYDTTDIPPLVTCGTTIGVGVTKIPEVGQWALMGETPFTFTADGSTVFADVGDCGFLPPANPPADLDALEMALAACAVAKNERHDMRLRMYTQRPDYSHASACHIHAPDPPPAVDMGQGE